MFSTANGNGTVIIRNVGAVAVTIGNLIATGISSNTGFDTANTTAVDQALPKGNSFNIDLGNQFLGGLASGDVVTIKVTTDKGTFAQQSYTVP